MRNNFFDKSKHLPEGKLKNQCRSAEAAMKFALIEVFGHGKPLDRVISGYFRTNRQIGSRDRQFVSESIFSAFRHFGGLRKLLSHEILSRMSAGDEGFSALDLGIVLYGGLLLDDIDFEALRFYREKFGKIIVSGANELAKTQDLLKKLNCKAEITENDLLPKWVRDSVASDFDLAAYVDILTTRPPLWIRRQKGTIESLIECFNRNNFVYKFHPLMTDAAALENPKVNLYTLDEFKNGGFEIQDLASQVIGLVMNPKVGGRYLDFCAGAGGKTLQLATLMQFKGTVVAEDIRAYKLQDLKLRARRAQFPNIVCKENDGKMLKGKQAGQYDGVLVDAPCSCSGVWRRNVDGRWTVKKDDLAEIIKIQAEILENAAPGVKIDGTLVYATCSIFADENEKQVEQFLQKHPEFKLVDFINPLDNSICNGMLQVDPAKNNCDSMFVAKMKRK